MSEFQEIVDKLKGLEGRTIETIEIGETYDGAVHTITMKFTNGDVLEISPTSYNYGGQHLRVEID